MSQRQPARSQHTPSGSQLWQKHRRDARASIDRLRQTPLSSLMTVFVIAVALLLPALLLVLNTNLGTVLSQFRESARLTLYLQNGVTEAEAEELSEDLLTLDAIQSVAYISRSQALNEFGEAAGLQDLLASLSDNPLPASLVLTPADIDAAALQQLARNLQQRAEVEQVQLDQQWLQRLQALTELLGNLTTSLAVLVGLGVGAIVGNTIKLGVENRKAEIRVLKLVGGTDAYIARPFLYSGLLYGSLGGLLTALLLGLVGLGLRQPLAALTGTGLQGLGFTGSLLLILLGGALGWIAALLASWRYIRQIDP